MHVTCVYVYAYIIMKLVYQYLLHGELTLYQQLLLDLLDRKLRHLVRRRYLVAQLLEHMSRVPRRAVQPEHGAFTS